MMDQHNEFRELIENGDAVFGARTSTFSPAAVEIYGSVGFDFVWLDFEHSGPSPWDGRLFEGLCRAAELSGTELLVRTPMEPDIIRKVLDAGVRNILIPRVDGSEEVRRAVEASRFQYDGAPGERGYAGWRSSEYGAAKNYAEREDVSVCIGVMIEKKTALNEIDDILAVPDLGFVFIGPSDLSTQLGHPGDKQHPAVQEAIADIEERAVERSVPLGGIAHDPDEASSALDRGYQILRLGGELEAARKLLGRRLEQVRES